MIIPLDRAPRCEAPGGGSLTRSRAPGARSGGRQNPERRGAEAQSLLCRLLWLGTIAIGLQVFGSAFAAQTRIDVWYGAEQHFGQLGNPQPRINVLGNVAPADAVAALSYSLNAAPPKALTMGSDLRRLARPGDFNIEIERTDLKAGWNDVHIVAGQRDGAQVSRNVRVHYTPGRVWPLSFTLSWSKAAKIWDVAEVMDGRWKLTPDGVRILEPYYDRVLLIGDLSWTDYEVLTSVVIHRMLTEKVPPRTPPYQNHAHASVLLRWRGHPDDGRQPRSQWRPTGGLAMWRVDADKEGIYWVWHGGESGILATQEKRQPLEPGRRHLFRGRVETLPGPRTRYSIRSWSSGTPEPREWDLVAIDGGKDMQSGSLALVAHHADVTFGDVEVRPLTAETTPRSP